MGPKLSKHKNRTVSRTLETTTHKEPNARPLPPTPIDKITSTEQTLSKVIVRALYDYQGFSADDLPFKKGDFLEVDKSIVSSEDDWWIAKHCVSNHRGYIPSNYVVKEDATPRSQEWWCEDDRHGAEKRLLLPGHKNGTFLIRPAGDNTSYAISVLYLGQAKDEPSVRHYRIKKMDNGDFYISTARQFKTLNDLIIFYKSNSNSGLCCILSEPCPFKPELPPLKELEVARSDIQFVSKLGAGNFGEVWKGKCRKVWDVAIKKLKPESMKSEDFLQEAKFMHSLSHERIVKLMAVVSSSEPFLIVSELMIHGSLLEFLRSETGKKLKFTHLISMNSQIAEGMAFLETKNYIHRDLRAANILVGEQYCVKIADLGLARMLDNDKLEYEANENTKFPVKWTAPEAISEKRFTVKSDVWSFGVLMYEIITFGKNPYPGMSNQEVMNMLDRGGRMTMPANNIIPIPKQYYELMQKCWKTKPEERPTFESLHNLFDSYTISTEEQYG